MCGRPSVRVLLKRAIARRSMSPVEIAMVVMVVTVVMAVFVRSSVLSIARMWSRVGWRC